MLLDPAQQQAAPMQQEAAPQAQPESQAAPPQQANGPQPGGSPVPEQKRDYRSNPPNAKDKEQVDAYGTALSAIMTTDNTKKAVLGRIQGKDHPYKDIARAAVQVSNMIEGKMKQSSLGEPSGVAQALGLANTVKQVAQLAHAAGKVNKPPKSEDLRIIYAQAVKEKTGQDMQQGKMSPKEAADVFGRYTNKYFSKNGRDPRGYYQSIAQAMDQKNKVPGQLDNRKPLTMADKLKGGLL